MLSLLHEIKLIFHRLEDGNLRESVSAIRGRCFVGVQKCAAGFRGQLSPFLYTQPGLFMPTFFLDCFFIFNRLFTREKKDEKKIIFFNV